MADEQQKTSGNWGFLDLLGFEIFKIFSQTKSYLALLAFNLVPLLTLFVSAQIIYRLKSYHLEKLIPFGSLQEVYKYALMVHFKAFNYLVPFFLVLLLCDSISGELNRGTLKTLLLRPIGRGTLLFSKISAAFLYVGLAGVLGIALFQFNFFCLKMTILTPEFIKDLGGTTVIPLGVLLKLLAVSMAVTACMVAFIAFISVFIANFTLAVTIAVVALLFGFVWAVIDPLLAQLNRGMGFPYVEGSTYFFTYPMERLTDLEFFNQVVDGMGWWPLLTHPHFGFMNFYSLLFLVVAFWYFGRRDILG